MRGWLLLALAPFFVLASSWAGLNVYPILGPDGPDHDALGFFRAVWGDNLLADLVFVLGTLAAGWATYALARRDRASAAIAAGFALHWLTYLASYQLLSTELRPEGHAWSGLQLVAIWGLPGLLLAAIVPVALAAPRVDRTRAVAVALAAFAFILLSGAFRLMPMPDGDIDGALSLAWSPATPILVLGGLALASLSIRAATRASIPRVALAGLLSALAHVALLAFAVAMVQDLEGGPIDAGAALAEAAAAWFGPAVALATPLAWAAWERRREDASPPEHARAA